MGYPTNEFKYCCNSTIKELVPINVAEIKEKVLIDYRIVGGYNDNAIEVSWEIVDKKNHERMEWIYIKTFTGGQIKYAVNTLKNSFLFALADEDAYVYCDEDPCLECTFRCKRGFTIFAYLKNGGLIRIPIERMKASW